MIGFRHVMLGQTKVGVEGLISYYRFDNNGFDQVGGYTAILSGNYSFDTGVHGQAFRTSTITASAKATDASRFSFNNGSGDLAFSFSTWVDWDSLGTYDFFIMNRISDGVGEYLAGKSGSDFIIACFDQTGTANHIVKLVPFVPNPGQFYHTAFTYDGSSLATGLNIYVDGVKQPGTPSTVGTYTKMTNTGSNGVNIGSTGYGAHEGRFDGVGIWDKELSEAEVLAVYNAQLLGELV